MRVVLDTNILLVSISRKSETNWIFQLLLDADDNKFVYCAIASGADFIISEDRAFRILKKIPFPKVSCLTIAEFAKLWNI